jgi:hypothetical protein
MRSATTSIAAYADCVDATALKDHISRTPKMVSHLATEQEAHLFLARIEGRAKP